ncbi:LysR family transcriptional regulator [Azospirillum sp. SYSU D00513]|uniref:LysR family transcriptional regulator n=1 Tax=Azospirillum sp. SYSU D00513 TaxID=2812561 RepID=UPI001A976CD5|nr:LysR family transcriptional regulator [Azospirillum sp. SYSU D00513]
MISTSLRYFLEVARTGSLSEASARLHVTVSAISRQIAKLEEHFGTPLFDRHPRGMVLTPPGELLADYARRSALDAERVAAEVREGLGLRKAPVRVAASDGLARAATVALRAFLAERPDTPVELTVAPQETVLKQLRDAAIDLGLVFSLLPESDLRIEKSWTAHTCAFVRRGHPLAGRGSVTMADLRAVKLALPSHNTIARIVELLHVEERAEAAGIFTTNSFTVLCDYVRAEGAVGVASDIAVRSLEEDGGDGPFVVLPFAQPDLHKRTVQLYAPTERGLTSSALLVRDAIVQAVDPLVAETQ